MRAPTPSGKRRSAAQWDEVERAWETKGEPGTLAYALPALCNLCQLPTVFVRPGRNTACTAEANGDVIYSVLNPAVGSSCRSFDRFAGHKSVVDRIVAGNRARQAHQTCTAGWASRPLSRRARTSAAGSAPGGWTPFHGPDRSLVASVYLFGYLEDDFYGRVVVTSEQLTIGELAAQLAGWSYEHGIPIGVTNEAGDALDMQAPIHVVGLRNGDIFTVRRSG